MIALIVLPYLGVLVYLIVNHRGIADRRAQEVHQAQQAFDERVREVAATSGPAAEIEKAQALLQAGAISQAEFERLKARALKT